VRSALAALVRAEGYEHREQPFRLSSGGFSHDYVDGKHAVATGRALNLACQAMIDSLDDPFDSVGGPTMGADALAHGVSVLSGCSWFSVRKEPKGHGRTAWIEGARLAERDRVLIVEDVVSTGASLLKAVEKVRDLGADVVAATALLDRSPRVAEAFDGASVRWLPLLSWSDINIDPL
jgi:orotate phosphoribosyltransferase